MDPHSERRPSDDSLAALYEASPPIVSPVWRLHFLNAREASQNDVFALLHAINRKVAINVKTVVRTWDEQTPIYWILFEDAVQALVARGFAANAEGENFAKVSGALVKRELFSLAEEEENNPLFVPPIATNRWDNPIQFFSSAAPHYLDHSATPPSSSQASSAEPIVSQSNVPDTPNLPPTRPLLERIQHATLLERLTLT